MKISSLDLWSIAFAVVSLSLIAEAAVLYIERIWLFECYGKEENREKAPKYLEEISRRRIPMYVRLFFGASLACIAIILQLS